MSQNTKSRDAALRRAVSDARLREVDIAARLQGKRLERAYQGEGSCYLEFGGGQVAKVEANFLGGSSPTARIVGPSEALAAEKVDFAATRRARWFGT